MKWGLAQSELAFLETELFAPLKKRKATLWIFGSRARGDHHPFSDLDVMVESSDRLSDLIAELKETFEKGNFPYKIDIVELRNFVDSYRPSFEAEKIRVP